jgi:predicted secreted protein
MHRFDDPTQIVRVRVSEEFAVALAGNPTTGYTWQPSIHVEHLELLGQTFEPSGEGVGAGGREVFHFHPRTAGETEITFEYRRPWGSETRDTKRFRIVIE